MAGALVDALLGSTTEVLVEKAINLASEQIGQFVGFKKDLEKLKDTLIGIQAFLRDAEKEQVTKEFVKRWLENLERVAFDAGNLLDDVNYEMIRRKVEIQNQMKRKVCLFFSLSNPIAFRLEKNRKTTSLFVDQTFVGRDGDVLEIVGRLTAPSNNENISVQPIVGMGGIGKTTLARQVFNDPKIVNHFAKRIWVCVSDDFDVDRLFDFMLESLGGQKPGGGVRQLEAKVQDLKNLLDDKKFLLVLDDVWDKESTRWNWNEFLGSLRGTSQAMGSWILVTTREQQVVDITRISSPQGYSLKQLSDDQCWHILKENAFCGGEVPDGLQDIGLKIAQRCRGLPLAASVLGGMLRNKEPDEWQSLESGFQSLGGDENVDVTNTILKLSFDHLPHPSLKKCFAYCSIFPKDFQMERNELIQLWAAEGFLHSNPRNDMHMEEVGNRYFTILLDSNLFQDAEKDDYGNVLNCKMHDLVHDMVQSISNSKTLRLTESGSVLMETSSIRYLALERSEKEMTFSSTESFKQLHSFLDLFDALPPPHPYFPFLSWLLLYGWPHWESLPEQLQHLSALTTLALSDFGVKSLPDWFGKLSSLEELELSNCRKLENLPSHQSMRSLTRLRKLWITHCPLLKERCDPESSSTDPNSERSKISHIPTIVIDWENIRG
ncbi:unnamed protein product [Coffea canephora]|uniref:Disease resistance protein RGA3 n=1 Tax=Coffea canephora TaxID=49390 RepID=A0A068U4D3_COFCA|nr:unnamed protein product [Coffea canephora]